MIQALTCEIYDNALSADLVCVLCEHSGINSCGTILAEVRSSSDGGIDAYTYELAVPVQVDNSVNAYLISLYPMLGASNVEWKNVGASIQPVNVIVKYTVERPM
jgi:hypothetical protein